MMLLLLLRWRIIVLLLLVVCLLVGINLLLGFVNIEIIFLFKGDLLFKYVQHLVSCSVFC